MNKRNISQDLESKLLVESRNRCNLCWKNDEVQIHHIVPIEMGGNNSEENLIVLCLICHSKVHTKKMMARNFRAKTLILYKETWIDLIKRFPLTYESHLEDDNDIIVVKNILKQSHRRALFFPFNLEIGYKMFQSLERLIVYIQSSGYKLLNNKDIVSHIGHMYKNLCEATLLNPRPDEKFHCLHGELGRANLELLELKRKTICFHINEIAKIAGYENTIIDDNEFEKMNINVPKLKSIHRKCFGNYGQCRYDCDNCEFMVDCMQATEQY